MHVLQRLYLNELKVSDTDEKFLICQEFGSNKGRNRKGEMLLTEIRAMHVGVVEKSI